MTARYQLTLDKPIPGLPGDGLLKAGSIIDFDGEPGDYMIPLNDEAQAAADAFWTKEFEYEVYDPDLKRMVTRVHQPRLKMRPGPMGKAVPKATLTLVAEPEKDTRGMTLAEVGLSRPAAPQIAPPPDRAQVVRAGFDQRTAPQTGELEGTGINVVEAAPPEPYNPRAPNISGKKAG